MKKLLSTSLFCAAVIAQVAVTAANAQTSLVQADIPFAFLAGEQTHPAGNYWVRVDAGFRFLELRPVKGTGAYRVALTGGQFAVRHASAANGSLRFNRYGDAYALEGASGPMLDYGLKAAPSKAATELSKSYVSSAALVVVGTR